MKSIRMIVEYKYGFGEYDWEEAIIENLKFRIKKRVDKIKNDNKV